MGSNPTPGSMKYLTEAKYVSKWAPVVSILFIDVANIGHIWRMFSEQSAAGQSLVSWACVWIALVSWFNFYLRVTPGEEGKVARYSTILGIGVVTLVISSILYFRYLV